MAKLTIAGLKTFVATYVAAASIAQDTFTGTYDSVVGMLDKIGKQIQLDNEYIDKLALLDGEELPLGKTIEEYFIDLILPAAYDKTGAADGAPSRPTTQDVLWSYALGRKIIKITEDYGNVEQACSSPEALSDYITTIIKRLEDSEAVYKLFVKKQMIGRAIDAVVTAGATNTNLLSVAAKPSDTASGEAFMKSLKLVARRVSWPKDNETINSNLTQIVPEKLVLFVDSSLEPVIDIDVLAGAFNSEKVMSPVRVIYVDELLDTGGKAYALLCDERMMKLHPTYKAIRSRINADGDFVNFVKHVNYTAFFSKNAVAHVWKTA